MSSYIVAALYKFAHLPDYAALRDPLLNCMLRNKVIGSLLLAEEGINGTIAGERAGIDAVLAHLKSDPRLADLPHKESTAEEVPFYRTKVKLKKEIVTMGIPQVDPNRVIGTYIKPEDWNALISDPDVLVLDTRNDYEYELGTFKGAIDPDIKTFRDFPGYINKNLDPKNHKKVAMFCTGGIRCEKSTSHLLSLGFEDVYHLQGGILKYLENVPEAESLWQGECFVFDNRVTVIHDLKEGHRQVCRGCRHALSEADKNSPEFEEGVSCPSCFDSLTPEQLEGNRERQYQMELAEKRGTVHLGGQQKKTAFS